MPTRHRLTDKEKKNQAHIERNRVDAHMAQFSGSKKPKALPTASQNRSAAAGKLREKYTPPGIQYLVDVLTKEKERK